MKHKQPLLFFTCLCFITLGIFSGVKIYQVNQDNSKYQITEVAAERGQAVTMDAFEFVLEEIQPSYEAYDEEFSINKLYTPIIFSIKNISNQTIDLSKDQSFAFYEEIQDFNNLVHSQIEGILQPGESIRLQVTADIVSDDSDPYYPSYKLGDSFSLFLTPIFSATGNPSNNGYSVYRYTITNDAGL